MYKKFILCLSFFALTACDDTEEYLKCGIAAKELGQYKAQFKVEQKMSQYIQENSIKLSSRKIMELGQEVRDEIGVHEPTLWGILKIIKTYNSCTDIHEQPKLPAPTLMYYLAYPFL
ncbi:hypothetical protein HYE59_05390 [Aggregatibacter actinomycetemcomitans]|uniref:hypothetical protein n=1 Tax=Aggregatibacter actinomycetemcomitans TaxID=714 RepID=UPI00197C24D7|nr:hypothetical protein [Aggregatibacter actinomycetemcomitans]MBN6076982.1 hypothetical protein [Aggregatibacter actinomycetemcomitans]